MRIIIALSGLIFGLAFAQHSLAESVIDLAYRLKASVVKVHVATKNGGHGVGTGVVVGKDLVATNCHVLANSTGVKITKFGDSSAPVALKADWKHDLCILRFQYLDLKPVVLGDSEQLKYESPIFSIGFPGGPPKPQVTEGKIKALYKMEDSQIVRTDASFVMGASGSPVFDSEGKLIAISTFKSPGHNAYYYNLPVKWVKTLMEMPESAETVSMMSEETPFWNLSEQNRPFYMRVVLPFQNDKWDDLNIVAQDWVKKEPNCAEAHYYFAVAQENLGNKSVAKQSYAQSLKLHPYHPASLIALGLLANKEGNVAEVERLKVTMKESNPDVLEDFKVALDPHANEPPEAK